MFWLVVWLVYLFACSQTMFRDEENNRYKSHGEYLPTSPFIHQGRRIYLFMRATQPECVRVIFLTFRLLAFLAISMNWTKCFSWSTSNVSVDNVKIIHSIDNSMINEHTHTHRQTDIHTEKETNILSLVHRGYRLTGSDRSLLSNFDFQ